MAPTITGPGSSSSPLTLCRHSSAWERVQTLAVPPAVGPAPCTSSKASAGPVQSTRKS